METKYTGKYSRAKPELSLIHIFTKTDLREQIAEMELILFRLQNNLHTITGKPLKEGEDQVPTYLPESMQLPVDEYDKLYGDKEFSNIELAELNLKELHEKYNSAPEDEELGPPRYQIELKNSTLPQSNILCKKGDIRYSLNFINPEHGETGAALWVCLLYTSRCV